MRLVSAFSAAMLLAACNQAGQEAAPPAATELAPVVENAAATGPTMVAHALDAEAGRALFIEKGCVICHSVNGVGGKAAPALDAEIGDQAVDPLDFAARMWRGAPAMIELQSVELGYTIYLTADDISNIAAFASDRDIQKTVTLDSLPETTRNGLLDERFWELENWDDYLRSGREGEFDEDGAVEPEEPADNE
ncbi:MAG: c-type cytochrome [Parvularculaceae bacterium]